MSFEFENLDVYKRSKLFCKEVYRITGKFPQSEMHGLTSQLKRASVSVVANIAEGCGRAHRPDQRRFYNISLASIFECVALVDLGHCLDFISGEDFQKIRKDIEAVSSMLYGLIRYTKRPVISKQSRISNIETRSS